VVTILGVGGGITFDAYRIFMYATAKKNRG
jgi:hypothetical protein